MKFAGKTIHLIVVFLCWESIHAKNNKYYSDENGIRMLLEKMMAMEKQFKQMENREMETKHQLLQSEESTQREILYLKEKIIQQEREIQKLTKILPVRSKQDSKYSYRNTPDKDKMIEIRLNESSVFAHNVEKRLSYRFLEYPAGPVAFSTYLSQSLNHLGLNQVIKYGGVLTNEVNAYNPYTGIFTCPYSGLYLISFFTSIHGISGVWVGLVIDNITVSNAVSMGFVPIGDDQGGNVAILRLMAGQSVWTEIQFQKDANLSSTAEFRHVTFSGVRLAD